MSAIATGIARNAAVSLLGTPTPMPAPLPPWVGQGEAPASGSMGASGGGDGSSVAANAGSGDGDADGQSMPQSSESKPNPAEPENEANSQPAEIEPDSGSKASDSSGTDIVESGTAISGPAKEAAQAYLQCVEDFMKTALPPGQRKIVGEMAERLRGVLSYAKPVDFLLQLAQFTESNDKLKTGSGMLFSSAAAASCAGYGTIVGGP